MDGADQRKRSIEMLLETLLELPRPGAQIRVRSGGGVLAREVGVHRSVCAARGTDCELR
jgi:hypothetical protein